MLSAPPPPFFRPAGIGRFSFRRRHPADGGSGALIRLIVYAMHELFSAPAYCRCQAIVSFAILGIVIHRSTSPACCPSCGASDSTLFTEIPLACGAACFRVQLLKGSVALILPAGCL